MGNCGSLPKTKGGIDVSVPAPEPTTTKELVETKEEVKVQQEEKKIDGNVGEQNAGGGKSGDENGALAVGSLLNEVLSILFVMIIDQVHSFLFIFQLITLAD